MEPFPHLPATPEQRLRMAWEAKSRAEAMEEAAKICDKMESADTGWDTSYWNQAVGRCAFAIRAAIKNEQTGERK